MAQQTRTCKYGCNTTLGTFDTHENKFKELDGTLHTRERCESLKPRQNQKSTNGHDDLSVEVLLKKLQSIGISVDLNRLRDVK